MSNYGRREGVIWWNVISFGLWHWNLAKNHNFTQRLWCSIAVRMSVEVRFCHFNLQGSSKVRFLFKIRYTCKFCLSSILPPCPLGLLTFIIQRSMDRNSNTSSRFQNSCIDFKTKNNSRFDDLKTIILFSGFDLLTLCFVFRFFPVP